MAITGISSIDNKQIIAAGALSAISANQALITSGGDSLQGLYDTVSTNSGSWTGGGGSYPRNITADSILLSAEVTPGDSDLARVDILPDSINFSHPEQGYGTVDATTIQNWDSTYETVSENSASWTGGGGGSVTSPSGTIIVNGSNIEATNSAVGTIVTPSASALLGNNVNINGPWDPSPSVFNFTLPTSGGTLYAVRTTWYGTDYLNFSGKASNGDITTGTITVGGNPGTYTADLNDIVSDLSARGTQNNVRMEHFYVTSPSASNSGVYELAWKKDVPTGQFFTGYNTFTSGSTSYSAVIDTDYKLTAGNATYSLIGAYTNANNKFNKLTGSNTLFEYSGYYEMGNIAYKPDVVGTINANKTDASLFDIFIEFHFNEWPVTSKIDKVYLTFDATQSGTVNDSKWKLLSRNNNHYEFVKYHALGEDNPGVIDDRFTFNYNSWGTITNATASADIYSAFDIKELAFKDDLTGGSVPDEVMSAASAVSANSANWNEISAYQQASGSYLLEVAGDISVDSISLTGGSKQFETLASITGDSEVKGVTITPDGITLRNDIEGNQDVNVTEVAKWNETTDTLSSNSAAWGGSTLPMSAGDGIALNIVNDTLVISSTVTGGGSNDAFYIYPGTTTDKEIAENSAKDMRLYNTANNTYLDYAGKTTYPTYAILDFKNLSGVGSNTNTVEHVRVRVYPTATSACSIYTTGSVSLLASTSTVNTASTAYYDSDGNYLATTRNELTALSSFIQDNSASWTGGGGGGGGSTGSLIYNQFGNGYGGSGVYLSGSGDVVFRVYAPNGISTITIDYPDSYTQDTVYFSPDYDHQNWYTALYTVTGYANPNLNVQDAFNWEISAGDMRITNPSNAGFDVAPGSYNVNSTAYLTTGNIEKYDTQQGYFQTMTSWYDNLSNYQMTGAAGQDHYAIHMNGDQYSNDYNWEVTIQSLGGGGSTVTSADVFPPTTGLTPGMTYTLKWNDSYGLYWDMGN